ncbi:MAG TPA: betaine/proline/choline family ABC transporter ATP-binding protein [Candidatus Limnocylindrales bacterium]|nr:betaine/proline/choline family ABC transporter ATP-binding protein [Candidatus Limnocylindrales bacterium]
MANALDVEFRHVSRRYGTVEAVHDLSLSVPAGKICVLVGPSGCGKTTTLKMVNRLIEPTGGQILIGGKDVTSQDPITLRRSIGYVIQQVGLMPHMTVADNVAVVPRLLGWDAKRIAERSDELLQLVGLEPGAYRDRYPAQLSGGERQRVGVARALAADPPVMLMDEPFGAVDPIVRDRLQNELLRLQEDLAKTILFVTHDIDEAIKMGDLIAVMQVGGFLAQFGPPAEILSNPSSEFVARFVGADRGLKRLSLRRVAELELQPPVSVRVGEPAETARGRLGEGELGYVLLVDDGDRPIGWLNSDSIPESGTLTEAMSESMSPTFSTRSTLKDALSQMLDADVMIGIVVDRNERVLGLVTVEQIAAALRETRATAA